MQGPADAAELMIDFVAPVYSDDTTGRVHIFGPTLRLRAGNAFSITLRNNLTNAGPAAQPGLVNGFSHPVDTNLHCHGLHVPIGGCACGAASAWENGL